MVRPVSRRLTASNLRDALFVGIAAPLVGGLAGVGLAYASAAIVDWWLA